MASNSRSLHSDKTYIGRFCAIDIGTVTCRMLIADAYESGDGAISIFELDKQYEVVNLGEGVDSTRRLSSEALARTERALRKFVEVRSAFDMEGAPVISTMAVATSATRDAENSHEFTNLMDKLGIGLNVISGQQEASFSFAGASHAYQGEKVVIVDVGGGSTEVVAGIAGGEIGYSRSFDIGSRRITERFWDGYPCSPERIDDARHWAQEVFSEIPTEVNCVGGRMIAVAGTATSVVTIHLGMHIYDAEMVNGAVVGLDELEAVEKGLASLDLEGIENTVGLDPRRAPVIVGGMIILEEAMKALRASAYTASESDILEGIVMYNASQYIASN